MIDQEYPDSGEHEYREPAPYGHVDLAECGICGEPVGRPHNVDAHDAGDPSPDGAYAARVTELEAEGLPTSDAQGVAEAEGLDPTEERACPNCGDVSDRPCGRCAEFGPHGGECDHRSRDSAGRPVADEERAAAEGWTPWLDPRPTEQERPERLSVMARRVTANKLAGRRLVWEF